MEYEKIKQLMDDMGNSKLTNVEIEFPDGTKISMKKENIIVNNVVKTKEIEFVNNEEKAEKVENGEEKTVEKNKNINIVKSPMVGTFYSKPAPDKDPYVEQGTSVKIGDTLCIIEAMKLMNEIESEYTGKIVNILVKDGDVVEYGTPLFEVE